MDRERDENRQRPGNVNGYGRAQAQRHRATGGSSLVQDGDRIQRAAMAPMTGQEADMISLRAILGGMWRNGWIMVLTTAAGLALAYHYAYNVATPLYRANASVVVETRERPFVNLQEATGDISGDATSLNTEVGVLRGRELMGRVVDKLDLVSDPEFNPLVRLAADFPPDQAEAFAQRGYDIAVLSLLGRTEVRNLPVSLIFEIAVTTTDPTKSMQIANAIVDEYIAEQIERKVRAVEKAGEWLQARVAQLRIELQEAEARVERFRFNSSDGTRAEDIVRQEQLKGEADAIRNLYNYLVTRLQENAAQQGLQRADSRVLSHASLPLAPIAPRRALLLAIGGALGLFAGLVVVFVKEASVRSIRSTDALERLTGRPVIGEMPEVGRRKRRSPIKGLIGHRALLHSEALNNLLTNLLLSRARASNAPQVIVLISSVPGEGKTSLALSMAQNLALRGRRTLLIDGDMRKRTLTRQAAGDKVRHGLLSVLRDGTALDDAVLRKEGLSADMLCCESPFANPAALFASESFKSLLGRARERYDAIIIDTPPLMAVSDALPVGKAADCILFLVRWSNTHATKVQECLKMMRAVDLVPAGLVMTRIKETHLGRAEFKGYLSSIAPRRGHANPTTEFMPDAGLAVGGSFDVPFTSRRSSGETDFEPDEDHAGGESLDVPFISRRNVKR
jgi:capsular exopolysaccharide synthesis family protein